MKLIIPFLIWNLMALPLMAQYTLKGIIADERTGESLPFVNVVINNDPHVGTISDIDGKFRITINEPARIITFSYIGYERKVIEVDSANVPAFFDIKLKKEQVQLKEVVILPDENPAHRIIKKVIEQKAINDPERLESFKYTSYNKFTVTASMERRDIYRAIGRSDTAEVDSLSNIDTTRKVDSTTLSFKEHLERHHLFMMESVSEKKYLKPDLNNEKVLATKVSGLKNPSFFLLATQFQSFSFYRNHISLLDKDFLNPISNGSISKYIFILEDTIYNNSDTVFVISFLPKKNKNFDGLKGVLYINTNTYAIQNVIAEPAEDLDIKIKIQQLYEFIDGRQWFPVQLNTDILFKGIIVNGHAVIGAGRAYIKDIQIEPKIRKREFSPFEAELDPNAAFKEEKYWLQHRYTELDSVERNTYDLLDSVGAELNFDQKLRWFNALTSGKLRVGKFDLLLKHLFHYNNYEGIRSGMGAATNERISTVISFKAFGAYGFKDNTLKYGAGTELSLSKRNEATFALDYEYDVKEAGGMNFHKYEYTLQNETIKRYLIRRMYHNEMIKATFNIRTFKYAYLSLYGQQRQAEDRSSYTFFDMEDNIGQQRFDLTEVGFRMRYAFREKLLYDGTRTYSVGTKYPVLWMNYQRGFNWKHGEIGYNKVELKIEYDVLLKNFGTTSFSLTAGYTDGQLPYFELFSPASTKKRNSFYQVEHAFNTMKVQEYLSDKIITGFVTHDFGRLLYRSERFQPALKITTGIGYGTLSNENLHKGIIYKTLNKGYFESGIIVNDILKLNYFNIFRIGLGVGVFYRYGPYNTGDLKEDGAIRMSFTFGT